MKIKEEDIAALVANEDWGGLDVHYEKLIVTGTKEEKELLADGYLDHFAQLNYDFACGKISDGEVSFFLDIVSKAEALTDKKHWFHRAVAYHNMMQRSLEENKLADFFEQGNKACEAYQKSADSGDEKIEDNYTLIAQIYEQFTQHHPSNQLAHWQQGIQYLKKSISTNPLEARWELYIKMLYFPYASANDQIGTNQGTEKINFHHQMECVAESVSIYPVVAQAYADFKEHLSFYKMDAALFPERVYQDILEKATLARPTILTYFSASDAGSFFHKEGVRLSRIDMLMASMYYYERLIGKQEDHSYAIRCVADIYEDIAHIYADKAEFNEANLYLDKAYKVYTENLAAIESDFAPVTAYAGFLERCFNKNWYKNKPTLAVVKQYAELSIIAGQGHYLIGPMILARALLLERKEAEVIALLTKQLVLHELSLLEDFITLQKMDLSGFDNLGIFIDAQIKFFAEVRENYGLDPKIGWEKLINMTDEEISKAWELRKTEIRNSPIL